MSTTPSNTLTPQEWDALFVEARDNQSGLLISKVAPPSGCHCDHKESVWDFHQQNLHRLMQRHGFHVASESRTQVRLAPNN